MGVELDVWAKIKSGVESNNDYYYDVVITDTLSNSNYQYKIHSKVKTFPNKELELFDSNGSSFFSKEYDTNIKRNVVILQSGFMRAFELNCKQDLTEEEEYTRMSLKSITETGNSPPITSKRNTLQDALSKYAFKKHLLIQGHSGIGKTYQVQEFASNSGYYSLFIGCHSNMTNINLLGHYVINETGGMVWKDGIITEGARKAKNEKVIVILDEFLRLPPKSRNILLSFLVPSVNDTYILRTERITNISDGIGTEEILEIPKENFWVIGTTNRGSKFDTEEMDMAMSDRFRFINYIPSKEVIKEILTAKGVKRDSIMMCLDLINKSNQFVNNSKLDKPINLRHIMECLDGESEITPECVDRFYDLISNLTSYNMDGLPNKEEFDTVVKLYESIFKFIPSA